MRLKFFFSRTLEKLGRMCDQIGRTLEPCNATSIMEITIFSVDTFYVIESSLFLVVQIFGVGNNTLQK